ncbi:MAG TPA: TetR/AcrR family transcriptional regulator [Candidatus Baltobacteraceae bacterium]|nr:TetR/AcrR family transcriptional regulator [Candidatus Baltobacteraceae bacterium]
MARTPDAAARERLLERIIAYVTEHGVAGLSLRPLAAAVGSSPRVLLYHFGSKEDLVTKVLMRAGERQRAIVAQLRTRYAGSIDGCREMWNTVSDPAVLPTFYLFFEVYALALRDRDRYAAFLSNFVAPWLAFIGDPLVEAGWTRPDADAFASYIVAVFRGFLLDLCATGDRDRVNRAVELWLTTLSAAGAEKDLAS